MATFKKGSDWEKTSAFGTEDTVKLEAGGYVCKIVGAKIEKTKNTGKDVMVLAFDIAEGEYTGFYDEQFKMRQSNNKDTKWGGTYRQLLTDNEGKTNPFFKGLITSIEKSNNITLPDEFTDNDLKGKLFGGLFGREEFEGRDGKTGWTTRLVAVRSVEAIRNGDFVVPEDKKLNKASSAQSFYADVSSVSADDDLPF
jgi:hypothetical protein